MDRVRTERMQNNREVYRKNWWMFGEPRKELRPALLGLCCSRATVQTSKQAIFQFLPETLMPDATLIVICLNDAAILSVISSRFHVAWAHSAGGWLGVGNDARYNHLKCFYPSPIPTPTELQTAQLRDLGEQLDAHRKAQQGGAPQVDPDRNV